MYGRYEIPFEYSDETIALSITEDGDFFRYTRQISGGESVQKTLLTTGNAIVTINPIEPVNLPKPVTHYLEIEFPPVLIEPEGKKIVYLMFPIEIGVIVFGNRKMEAVDIFSFCPQKYSLYGPSGGGVITKYYASDIFSSPPESDRYCNGVLRLEIHNKTTEWANICRTVLDGYSMKIYYGPYVSMLAHMKILTPTTAETEFVRNPAASEFQKAVEVYHTLNIPSINRTFLMEWGY
ncbi:DUF432 domain-containing protein [Methanogenium organophilum]|uniref:DUF432 domain-containing protein n=1 Tax=Methanogenium organophilum TaxID=2199 RepID=A0A9X9S648_METOG|nr:DUF432 domain-containing protein [Methanogenium organophilum]WAI01595.1 DUF432 domain-containing protein [Methanogenium organophilum]